MKLSGSIVLFCFITLSHSLCPEYYSASGVSDCFKVSEEAINTFEAAKTYCAKFGGALVENLDQSKNAALKNFLKTDAKCNKPTASGKSCSEFTYKGVKYEKGECTFDDAFAQCPWCAIVPINGVADDFVGGAGEKNWDYCNPQCCDLFRDFWIGLTSTGSGGVFTWSTSDSKATFFDWGGINATASNNNNSSSNNNNAKTCVVLDSSSASGLRWATNDCTSLKALALCEPTAASTTTTSSTTPTTSTFFSAFRSAAAAPSISLTTTTTTTSTTTTIGTTSTVSETREFAINL